MENLTVHSAHNYANLYAESLHESLFQYGTEIRIWTVVTTAETILNKVMEGKKKTNHTMSI